MRKPNFLLPLILVSSLAAMSSCRESRLETALRIAGDNRPEMEQVLAHYSADQADSLKYRAARFLIENMPLHYGYEGPGMEHFKLNYNHLFCDRRIPRDELRKRAKEFAADRSGVYHVFDIVRLDHRFLINHIDQAFEVWDYPWSRELTFDDFCERVLPYRIANEQPEEWMPAYRTALDGLIRKLADAGADRHTAVTTIQDSLRRMDYEVIDESTMKLELRPSDYIRAAGGACPEITSLLLYALRSVGLPVDYDYIIQWANRNQTHSWNSLRIGDDAFSFGMSDAEFGKHFEARKHERKGKVYRKMFSFQPQSLPNQPGAVEEKMPPAFRSPFIKDVSELYFEGIDVTLKLTIPGPEKKKFAYLAVFDNRNWVPVAWSRIKRGEVTFEKIEKGCAYLVMYYHEGRLYPATDAFTLSKEGLLTIRKPSSVRHSADLKRKYPVFFDQNFILNRVHNGKFQIADDPEFSNPRTIYVTPPVRDIHPYYADLGDTLQFKYIRYLSPSGAFVNMAEIGFFDPAGNKLVGKIIGTEGSWWDPESTKDKLFDGNPLTYFDAPQGSGCWGGMAFDTPQTLGSVMFLPRNDDNFIQLDEQYELFYCDNGEFVSLGRRIGDRKHVLHYQNVPANAILLLRNHTKGKEERIFTYENGQPVWW